MYSSTNNKLASVAVLATSLGLLATVTVVPLSHAQPAGPGSDSARILLDADRNGEVSQDEFVAAKLARTEQRFSRLDRNEDGVVTSDDIAELPEPPDVDREALRACIEETLDIELPPAPEPGSRFDSADLNGDGMITLDESLARAEEVAISRFANLDDNADGVLQRSEIRRPLRRLARLRQARRQCLDEQQEIAAILGD